MIFSSPSAQLSCTAKGRARAAIVAAAREAVVKVEYFSEQRASRADRAMRETTAGMVSKLATICKRLLQSCTVPRMAARETQLLVSGLQ